MRSKQLLERRNIPKGEKTTYTWRIKADLLLIIGKIDFFSKIQFLQKHIFQHMYVLGEIAVYIWY